jgi:hypothetical protein
LSLRRKHSSHLCVFQYRHFVFFLYLERSSPMSFINGIYYDSLF